VTLPDWPRAFGAPPCQARLRECPEDFRVDEVLGFAPDGAGEHLLVQVRKRNRNTEAVARALAQSAGIRARDVSYGGLKDRVAVTTQWFSLWLPGRPDPDWSRLPDAEVQVLAQARHRRKLPRGAQQANRFVIVLRKVAGERAALEDRLTTIRAQGVPNYFGEQRFGRAGDNLNQALAMFRGRRVKDRHLHGLYLSAARSYLFNLALAARVLDASWNHILPGEACMLAGSRSFFRADAVDETLAARCRDGDIAPSGPLWGRGEPPCAGAAREQELAVLAREREFQQGLEAADLKQERRALRLTVNDLQWRWLDDDALELAFELPAGAYATAVLREVASYSAADS
jgi:tRNA pseudouridine13 synthase